MLNNTPFINRYANDQRINIIIQLTISLTVQYHTAGDLHKAENIYQQILQAEPNPLAAMHLLSVIAHQVGKNDISFGFITKALTINPNNSEAYSNLDLAPEGLGKLDEFVPS